MYCSDSKIVIIVTRGVLWSLLWAKTTRIIKSWSVFLWKVSIEWHVAHEEMLHIWHWEKSVLVLIVLLSTDKKRSLTLKALNWFIYLSLHTGACDCLWMYTYLSHMHRSNKELHHGKHICAYTSMAFMK